MSDGPNRQYLSIIRGAIAVNQRPTAAILRDYWALNRSWYTDEPWSVDLWRTPDAPEWTAWDYALLEAYQMVEDYTNQEGEFPWVDGDEELHWKIELQHSSKREAIESYTEKAQKDGKSSIKPGTIVNAVIDWQHSRSQEKKKPSEWFREQAVKNAENQPRRDELVE